jgi:hypothetical protein
MLPGERKSVEPMRGRTSYSLRMRPAASLSDLATQRLTLRY